MMTTPSVPHRFELELVVPGTPAQVWRAIATAGGVSSWMMPTTIEERVGGAVTFDMGPDATSHGRVTAFESERRFAYEEDWGALVGHEGAEITPLATEFLVEAASGGTCVVRVVTSAFGTGADWENEFWEEMSHGWAPILDNLRLYLETFPDRDATTMWVGATLPSSPPAAIDAVRRALGVAVAGDRVDARGVTGRVERSIDRHVLVRVETPVEGFVSFYSFDAEGGSAVHLQAYLFSDGAPSYVAAEQPSWEAWLEEVAAELGAEAPR